MFARNWKKLTCGLAIAVILFASFAGSIGHVSATYSVAPAQQEEPNQQQNLFLPALGSDLDNSVAEVANLSSSADWTFEVNQADADFGYSHGVGDFNGDGYIDVAIGAGLYDNGETNEGSVFVFLGGVNGFESIPDWSYESDQESASLGGNIASAGDVNDDGYDDLIVGVGRYDNGQLDEGAAFVFYGSVSGLPSTPSWTYESNNAGEGLSQVASAGDVNGDGYDDVILGTSPFFLSGKAYLFHGSSTGLSSSPAWSKTNLGGSGNWGILVSSAGDVNNDGYDDVIVGNSSATFNQSWDGVVYVFHGSSTGLDSSANWTMDGDQVDARMGLWVDKAGDVNGDGYDDVVVGAFEYDNGQTDEGRAYVFHGSSGGLNTSPDWYTESDQAHAWYGFGIAGVGDVNGDGYDDVVIGAPHYDNGQTDEGRTYLYYGSSSGLESSEVWTVESNQAGSEFGISVRAARDVNNDGVDDVLVGAFNYDNGQTDEGVVFLYHGIPEVISGLQIVNTGPVHAGDTGIFTATVATGTGISYDWRITPHNTMQTDSGQSVQFVFPVTYTMQVTATNALSTVTASKVITLQ